MAEKETLKQVQGDVLIGSGDGLAFRGTVLSVQGDGLGGKDRKTNRRRNRRTWASLSQNTQ